MEVAEVEAFRRSKQNIQLDHQDGKRETLHQSNREEDILGGTSQPSSHEGDDLGEASHPSSHEEERLEVVNEQPQSSMTISASGTCQDQNKEDSIHLFQK